MLAAAFFISAFSSVIWIFYAFANMGESNTQHFVLATAVIILPVLVLWVVFGYMYQYFSTSVLNKNMYSLFKQMKKNQEYADVVMKILLEARESSKDGIILNKFDVFISDMNELLSEIIERSGISSSEQVDNLWIKVKNGGKWAFGKVLIDIYQTQPNLPKLLTEKAIQDVVLGGTVLEFCSRYQNLINILEKHDQERIFLNVIETGVYGKVFSLLAGPADTIRQNRELSLVHKQMNEVSNQEAPENSDIPEEKKHENIIFVEEKEETTEKKMLTEDAKRMFLNTFTRKKKAKEENGDKDTNDPLTMAFAKSFGHQEENIPHFDNDEEEIKFEETEGSSNGKNVVEQDVEEEKTVETSEQEIFNETTPDDKLSEETSTPSLSVITPELEKGFSQTQSQLSDLKKEWETAKQRDLSARSEPTFDTKNEGMPEPKINKDEDFSYPFGEWMNVENYHK